MVADRKILFDERDEGEAWRDLPTFAPQAHPAARATPADLLRARGDVLNRCLRDACALLNAPRGVLLLLNGETNELVQAAALGFSRAAPAPDTIPLNAGALGWVAVHLEPALIEDVTADDRHHPRFDHQAGGALAAVPLRADHILFGVLAVFSERIGAFKPTHMTLLHLSADLASAALMGWRQAQEAQRHQQQLHLLIWAARSITSSLEPGEVFRNIALGIGTLINYEDAMIYAYESASEDLRVVAAQGADGARMIHERVSLHSTNSLSAAVARHRRASCHAPDTHSLQPGRLTEAFLGGRERALLCVPLVSKEKLRGVVTLARPQAFDDLDVRMMEDLAPLVATAIENYSLYSAVKSEQERLATVFAATADGIAVVNGAQRVVDVNGAFARMALRPMELARGERFLTLFTAPGAPPDATRSDLVALTLAIEEALHGKPVALVLESTMPASVGAMPCQVLLSIAPIMTPNGPHVVVIARDVTELRALDRTRTRLLHMLSHEIRAPLVPLGGYLEMALRGMAGPLNDRQSDLIRRARSISRHLTARAKDFSTILSPEEAIFFPLEAEIVDIARVITSALEEVELLANEREMGIHVAMPPQLPTISGNQERLCQVVRNLLSNAIKFTPRGGKIWIEVRASAASLEVSVTDSGCGIASEHLPYLFDPFYQATGESGKPHSAGQGLGLAIVKQVVERHGGRIEVASTPGKGSRFTVVLPFHKAGMP